MSTYLEDVAFIAELNDLVKKVKLNSATLADEIRVSRPTFDRWLVGTNLPHEVLRPKIINYLKNKLEE